MEPSLRVVVCQKKTPPMPAPHPRFHGRLQQCCHLRIEPPFGSASFALPAASSSALVWVLLCPYLNSRFVYPWKRNKEETLGRMDKWWHGKVCRWAYMWTRVFFDLISAVRWLVRLWWTVDHWRYFFSYFLFSYSKPLNFSFNSRQPS